MPADPLVRREALRLARHTRLQDGGISGRTGGIVLAVLAVGGGVAGVFASRWWWLVGAIMLLAAGLLLLANRREQTHLTILEEAVASWMLPRLFARRAARHSSAWITPAT